MYFQGGKYEGCWKCDFPNGIGKFSMSDGSYMTGTFRNGQIHGFGKAKFANHDQYTGLFAGGRMTGAGVYYTTSTDKWVFG